MAWLLDTNVVSELRRPRPEPKVLDFVFKTPTEQLFISSVTLAELRFGIERTSNHDDRAALSHWLTDIVRPMFHHRILEVTEDIMLQWRILVENGRKSGHTYAQPDLIIAATALNHGFTLVTRDRKDFDRTKVLLLNPWDS